MTIRYTCDTCGSVLKIKDELAGTDGKCPKCKTRFVVPQPSVDADPEATVPSQKAMPKVAPAPAKPIAKEATSGDRIPTAKAVAKTSPKPPDKPAAKAPTKPADDDDFDPVSFLMEGPSKKPTFEPDTDEDDEPPLKSRHGSPSPRGGKGGRGFSLDDDENDDDFDEPPPTKKWGSKNNAPAGRAPVDSRDIAQDLLSRSMEESRVRAAEMPESKPRFDFDFAGFFREFGVKGIGSLVGGLLVAYLCYMGMMSMIGPKVKLPPLGYVSGTVKIKGKTVPGIRVYFTPLERLIPGANEKKERSRDSIGVTDADGRFEMRYLPDVPGVKVGPCRVWMESMDPTVVIPPKYGAGSVHQYDVKSGPNEPQNIEL